MTPKSLTDMLLPSPKLDKLAAKNKGAKNALKKMQRKLRAAQRAKTMTEVRMLIGMAQVALSKAEFLTRTAKGN